MRELFRPFLVSIVCVMALLAIHFVLPSMLNNFSRDYSATSLEKIWGHTFITETWQYHTSLPVFAARPLTSFLIDSVHRVFDLSYSYSFIVVEFGLLIVCGILMYQLALLFSSKREAGWTLFLFYTSFTILFAFFATIYTYDEPLQYACFFATLFFLERKRWVLFSLALFFALLARETTIFLLPSLFFFLLPNIFLSKTFPSLRRRGVPSRGGDGVVSPSVHRSLERRQTTPVAAASAPPSQGGDGVNVVKKIFLLAIPTLFSFVAVRVILAHAGLLDDFTTYTGNRFIHFSMNFQNRARGVESLVSPFLALLVPTTLALYYKKRQGMDERERRYFWAFVLATIINTPIVFFTALAQETRLFALPLLFLWPFLGKYARYFFTQFKLVDWRLLPMFAMWILASYFIAFRWYIPAALWDWHFGFQAYFCAGLLLAGWGILALRRS